MTLEINKKILLDLEDLKKIWYRLNDLLYDIILDEYERNIFDPMDEHIQKYLKAEYLGLYLNHGRSAEEIYNTILQLEKLKPDLLDDIADEREEEADKRAKTQNFISMKDKGVG